MPAVAVIGASNSRGKFGNKAVRAYLRQGWTVYPVNPNEQVVEGLPTFASIEAISGPVDRAALYVPAAVGITLLAGIARKGVPELFVNPGAESDELLAEAERLNLSAVQACAIVDIGERP
jgi:acyl-CoA synthetase (NDP forming)